MREKNDDDEGEEWRRWGRGTTTMREKNDDNEGEERRRWRRRTTTMEKNNDNHDEERQRWWRTTTMKEHDDDEGEEWKRWRTMMTMKEKKNDKGKNYDNEGKERQQGDKQWHCWRGTTTTIGRNKEGKELGWWRRTMIKEKKNNDGEEHSNNKEQRQKEKKIKWNSIFPCFWSTSFFFNNCYNFVSYMNLEFKKHDFMSLVLMNSSSLFDHCSNLRPGLGCWGWDRSVTLGLGWWGWDRSLRPGLGQWGQD